MPTNILGFTNIAKYLLTGQTHPTVGKLSKDLRYGGWGVGHVYWEISYFSRSLLASEQEVTYPSPTVTLIFLGAKAEYLIYY